MSSAVGMNLMPTTFHGLAASADTNGNLNSQQGQQQVQPSGVKDKHDPYDMDSSAVGSDDQNHHKMNNNRRSSLSHDMDEDEEDEDNLMMASSRKCSEDDDEDDFPPISRSLEDLDDDDDDEDSLRQPPMLAEDSLIEPEDPEGTYGSPGLRQVFATHVMDEDEDTKEESSALTDQEQPRDSPISNSNSRRNKRKNFKPRNIVSEAAEAAARQQIQLQQQNNAGGLNLSNVDPRIRSLMPRKLGDNSSPMDLSVQGANGNEDGIEDLEDDEDEEDKDSTSLQDTSSPGLSVVRPEILFGDSKHFPFSQSQMQMQMQQQQLQQQQSQLHQMPAIPPFLAPFLAASRGGPSMKDAFQEVLKLFGFTPELAEAFAKNAQAAQQLQQDQSSGDQEQQKQQQQQQQQHQDMKPSVSSEAAMRSSPSSSIGQANPHIPPGMLSAALMGSFNNILATPPTTSSHPPTPPRTPKAPTSIAAAMAAAAGGGGGEPTNNSRLSDVKPPLAHQPTGQQPPPMPPLLSLAAIQEQVKAPNNILAAQLNKPMMMPYMPGGPPGGLGMAGGPNSMAAAMAAAAGMSSQLPPHILAAQRAGVLPGGTKTATDYTRYFRRFSSSLECGSYYCKDMNYREHFHCTVPMCKSKVFAKKEEMIRHSKWHQKMDEAFKYGFRRVTPTDDCADQFPGCQHNKKQTHYHCIQSGHCDKVYISTSDVQMHFNYHRKDNAIQREGFMRFRGCEDCNTHYCPFRGQKTTHFHCNRSGCQFTFKNKADMEKHKNFHMKDEQLNKDGFKKFMKQDPCGHDNCRFSKTVNHIHCIRSNCDYVLHSSGQLYSHKRKHERKDNELAYRKYKLAQSMLASIGGNPTEEQKEQIANLAAAAAASMNNDSDELERPNSHGSMNSETSTTPPLQLPPSMQPQTHFQPPPPPPMSALSMLPHLRPQLPPGFGGPGVGGPMGGLHPNQPLPASGIFGHGVPQQPPQPPMLLSEMVRERVPDDAWQAYMLHFDSGEGCGFQGCEIEELSHYHCKDDGCEMVFRHEDGVREHGRNHFIQDQITDLFFVRGDPEDEPDSPDCTEACPHRKISGLHFHCKWDNCTEVLFNSDPPFKRLDHYKLHEYSRKWNFSASNKDLVTMTLTTSIDAMFKRKRGRPPKNRVIEVWNDNFPGQSGYPGSNAELHGSPQAVFTSFKLPKPGQPGSGLLAPNNDYPGPPQLPRLPQFPQLPVSLVSTSTNQSGLGSRLFPMGLISPPGMQPMEQPSPPKVSAPLGGLPALEDQIMSRQKMVEDAHRNSEDEFERSQRSPPSTPPPSKRRAAEGEPGTPSSEDTPPKNQGLIKAKGTYYPLTAFPTNMPQGTVMRQRGESPPRSSEGPNSGDETSPTISLKSKLGVNFMVSFTKHGETDNPLAKLLQASQEMVSGSTSIAGAAGATVGDSAEAQILSLAAHPQFGPEPEEESCGRPFCKLKRRPHYHCNICNQGFTERDKLDPHLKRHTSPEHGHMTNLASLLKEPLPQQDLARSSPLSLVLPPQVIMATSPMMIRPTTTASSSAASSPKSSSPPPLPIMPPASSCIVASAHSPSSSLITSSASSPGIPVGFPPGFASPFGLMRHPLTGLPTPTSSQAQTNFLLAQNPFLPPGILLPGMPPFPRFPGMPQLDLRLPTSPNSAVTAAALQSLQSRLPDPNSLKRSSPMSSFMDEDNLTTEQKKMRLQSSMRMLKDEPVPEGYMRFRFNEDCAFSCCNYREHQTHFHCMRKDCNYRFCDKTRFVQHTARHERLDTLCGNEFEGFRGVPCGRDACELNSSHIRMPLTGDTQKSSSHFHCLKCDYYCTDTNKVVAHRRQHQKLDSIMAAGFEKYTPTQFCPVAGCAHNGKQTHYHCSSCQYAVLGLSQMEGHKYRHMNE